MNKPSVVYSGNWCIGKMIVLINHLGIWSSILGLFVNLCLCKEIKCNESNTKSSNQSIICLSWDTNCSEIRTIVGPPPPPLIVPPDPDEEEFWVPIDFGCLMVAPSPLSSDGETDALLLSSWCFNLPPIEGGPPAWIDPEASSRRKLLIDALMSSIWVSVKSRSCGTVPLILWKTSFHN